MSADKNNRAVSKVTIQDVEKALEHIGQDDRFKDDANLLRSYIHSLNYRLSLCDDNEIYPRPENLWITTITEG